MEIMFWNNWFNREPITSTKERSHSRRVTAKVENGGDAAKEGLEEIFLGEDPNYNLAIGPYAKSISTVVSLIGIPQLPRSDDEVRQKQRDRLQKLINDEFSIIIKLAMVNGTHWVYPHYYAGKNLIEHIRDWELSDGSVRVDPISHEILSLVTKQQVYYTKDSENYFEFEHFTYRDRYFSREKIVERFEGETHSARNPIGIMPIPFAVNSMGDWRGHSLLTPILRLAADAHRIRANRDAILSTYKPQAIITTDSPDDWIEYNQLVSGDTDKPLDLFESQAKFCKIGESFAYTALGGGVVSDHNAALQDIDTQTQVSEWLPFIFSGAESRGNHATGVFQQEQGIFIIKDFRRQFYKATHTLINALDIQDCFVQGIEHEDLEPNYERMELMSDEQQVGVLERGMATIANMATAGIPIEAAFNTLKSLFDFKYETPQELHEAIIDLKQSQPIDDKYSDIFAQV